LAPTDMPTVKPTQAPTDAPTQALTDMPTVAPTVAPTDMPTVSPTDMPTVAPTAEPPTTTPPQAPVANPTARPSYTMSPTADPTSQASPIVSFQSEIDLIYVWTATLNSACQESIVEAAAEAMNLDPVFVKFVQVTGATGNSHSLRKHHKIIRSDKNLEDYSMTVVIETQVQVDFTDYDSSTDLYNGVTKLLDNAIKSGTFTDRMQFIASTLSASDLADAEATQVSSDAPTVTEAPGSSQKTATKHKFGAGAAVATVFLILFCIAVAGYYYQYHYLPDQAEAAEKAQKEAELAKGYVVDDEEEEVASPVHRH
jgi:hypothetical protein